MSFTAISASMEECSTIPRTDDYNVGAFVLDTILMLLVIGSMLIALIVMRKATVSPKVLLDKFILLEIAVTFALAAVYYSHLLRDVITSGRPVCQTNIICRVLAWFLISTALMRGISVAVLTLVRFLSVVAPYFHERYIAFNNRSIYLCLVLFVLVAAISSFAYLDTSRLEMRIYNGLCFTSIRQERSRAHWTTVFAVGTFLVASILVIDLMMLVFSRLLEKRTAMMKWDTTLAQMELADSASEEHELGALIISNEVPRAPHRSKSSGGILRHLTNNPHANGLLLLAPNGGIHRRSRGFSQSDSDIPSSLNSEFKRPMDYFQLIPPPRPPTHAPRRKASTSIHVRFAGRCRSTDLDYFQNEARIDRGKRRYSAISKAKLKLLQERFSASPITKLVVTTTLIHLVCNIPIMVSIQYLKTAGWTTAA